MGRSLPLILVCAQGDWKPTVEGGDVYRKELVYPGHFVKKNDQGEVEFELPVDDTLMDHWVATFKKMQEEGVEVPLPIEHTTDPEQRRGTVVDLKKEPNPERGENALYAYVKFRDAKAADLAKTAQVSLYSPPDFTSGKGTKFVRPIRHVALTDYPLIPGLEGFEAIAASHVLRADEFTEEEDEMNPLVALAERLGIDLSGVDTNDEEAVAQAIEDAWNADDSMIEEDPLDEAEGLGDEMSFDEFPEEEEEEDPLVSASIRRSSQPAVQVAASIVNQVAKARKTELDALVRDGNISPAARDRLARQYADPKKVELVLSNEQRGRPGDGFDGIVLALSQNGVQRNYGERTGAQHDPGAGTKSPLIADAERRAQRRNGKR